MFHLAETNTVEVTDPPQYTNHCDYIKIIYRTTQMIIFCNSIWISTNNLRYFHEHE